MVYYALKVLISALLIVAITELSKRNSGLAALLASLPLTSLLAFIWLHMEGTAASEIATLSTQIFWLVLPSLLLFMPRAVMLFPVHASRFCSRPSPKNRLRLEA